MSNQAAKANAAAIAKVLADSHVFAMKAHNFHWNVEGPQFFALHALFEAHYTEIGGAMDDLAERIRALGEYAPATSAEFAALASIAEVSGQIPAAQMLAETLADHETIGATIAAALAIAGETGDDVSAGLLGERLAWHQKQAWMIRATLA